MKKILTTLVAMIALTVSANAMSYEQARREALFLTDKMAYELNLSDAQYDAAYEINLDYLMGVTSVDDVYGTYWTRRNLDISYVLLDWQWNAFCAANYFYRPLYWRAGCWHFGIYARYPNRSYYYFHRPTVYVSYRGGHSWRANGGHSYYHRRRDHFCTPVHNAGMRDRWDRGEIGNRHYGRLDNDRNNQYNNRNNRNDRYTNGNNRNDRYTNGNNRNNSYRFDHNKGLERNSSTRITVKKRDESGSSYNRGGSSINRGGNSNGGNRNSGISFRQSGGSRQSQMKTI
ncbi:MAG: hypothetical protein PUH48_08710 [Prevotella sp.]|nr:hypothetical protein [Prevotella sp.]